jgi:hypothetical protein
MPHGLVPGCQQLLRRVRDTFTNRPSGAATAETAP